jgi:hypothetical protein
MIPGIFVFHPDLHSIHGDQGGIPLDGREDAGWSATFVTQIGVMLIHNGAKGLVTGNSVLLLAIKAHMVFSNLVRPHSQ